MSTPEIVFCAGRRNVDGRFGGGRFCVRKRLCDPYGIPASTAQDIRRYRVDGLRVWEQRDGGWFIHTLRQVPKQLVRVITRSDGLEVPIYGSAHAERAATKQASKKEIRDAQTLLRRDPLADTGANN